MKDIFVSIGIILIILFFTTDVFSAPVDKRICNTQDQVERKANGKIKRSMTVLEEYQQIHPCPSTGSTSGKCPGWALDHVIPLACGGCDAIENLQWLPNEIKSASGKYPKDRWERKINCKPMEVIK